jgi:uncharacterized membrane protein YjfL (UPF0719 family)
MITVLIGLTALGAIGFCFLYALLAPFYKSEGGWNMMAFMVIVGTMVTLSLYFRSTGTRAPDWLAYVLWGMCCACVWWRVTILLRAQLKRWTSR